MPCFSAVGYRIEQKYNGPTIERVQSWPSVNATSRLESRNHRGYGCCDNLRIEIKQCNDYIDVQIDYKSIAIE